MKQMQILREGIDHNYWARDRQLEACATLSREQVSRAKQPHAVDDAEGADRAEVR